MINAKVNIKTGKVDIIYLEGVKNLTQLEWELDFILSESDSHRNGYSWKKYGNVFALEYVETCENSTLIAFCGDCLIDKKIMLALERKKGADGEWNGCWGGQTFKPLYDFAIEYHSTSYSTLYNWDPAEGFKVEHPLAPPAPRAAVEELARQMQSVYLENRYISEEKSLADHYCESRTWTPQGSQYQAWVFEQIYTHCACCMEVVKGSCVVAYMEVSNKETFRLYSTLFRQESNVQRKWVEVIEISAMELERYLKSYKELKNGKL